MTETQLNLLREWFREEVEYLIRRNILSKNLKETYYDDCYYADKAFDNVVMAFSKKED